MQERPSRGERDRLPAYYSELLDRQESSGLSITRFAQEAGIPAATLYMWRRKLGRSKARETGRARLVEVSLETERGEMDPRGTIALVTARHRIELPADFDAVALRRLLEVLAPC